MMKLPISRLNRLVAWLLFAVLVSSACLSGRTVAEIASADTEANDDYVVLSDLLDAVNQNPAEGRLLETQESVDEYCLKLYGLIDPDLVQNVFYGGPEDAADLLKSLCAAIYGSDSIQDRMLELSEVFYVAVWTLIHADLPTQSKSRPAIKEIMGSFVEGLPADNISAAVDVCVDYIDLNEPELAQSGYNINKNATTINGSDEYIQYYQLGFQLFEEGKYPEAIEAYKTALSFKENDNEASLEIIQAYIAMRDYAQAKEWLAKTAPYVTESKYRARWLRSFGFIAIEELDYQMGYALYVYSLEFEQSQTAVQELQYIRYVAPDTKEFTAAEAVEYLRENRISFDD